MKQPHTSDDNPELLINKQNQIIDDINIAIAKSRYKTDLEADSISADMDNFIREFLNDSSGDSATRSQITYMKQILTDKFCSQLCSKSPHVSKLLASSFEVQIKLDSMGLNIDKTFLKECS